MLKSIEDSDDGTESLFSGKSKFHINLTTYFVGLWRGRGGKGEDWKGF